LELRQQINDTKNEKSTASSAKRKHNIQFDANQESDIDSRGQPKIDAKFDKEKKPLADAMILKYAVTQRASPHSLGSDDFMEMIRAVAEAGLNYKLPHRQAFGADSRNSPDEVKSHPTI
jgi:hypothetical protein